MTVSIGPIIGASTKIAEYLGLIEGVSTLITRLLHQAFNSAKSNLEYACNASGQDQIDYIKQARIEFNQAVAVEENENKLLALVGLSMCQYLLGDNYNAQQTLKKVEKVDLTRAEKAKYWALRLAGNAIPGLIIDFPGMDPFEARKLIFNIQKARALAVNKRLLQ